MPSMRGIEKPQMSASIRPTVMPRPASATARLAVTDDLPTPPLPEATRMTRVLAGNRSVGARSLARFRAIAMASAFSALVISAQLMRTSPTPGNEPTRSMMSRRSWAQWTPGSGQRQRDDDHGTLGGATVGPVGAVVGAAQHDARHPGGQLALGGDDHLASHAQLDDVGSQLGVDHMGEHGRHLVDRGSLRKLRRRHGDILLARTV